MIPPLYPAAPGPECFGCVGASPWRGGSDVAVKIFTRKRLSTTAGEQRMVSQAIKRARFMGLLPFTSATLG